MNDKMDEDQQKSHLQRRRFGDDDNDEYNIITVEHKKPSGPMGRGNAFSKGPQQIGGFRNEGFRGGRGRGNSFKD